MTVPFKRLLLICFVVAGARASFAAGDEASRRAGDWSAKHQHEIVAEFVDLLALPNLASDRGNIERNADAIRALCEKRGLTLRLLLLEGAPPIVVADLRVPAAKRTLAFYAH